MDVAQLMAAKRTDCVLVVESRSPNTGGKVVHGKLLGIFTAKDMSFRVAGAGLQPAATSVSSVMTPNPKTVSSRTEAGEALNIMTVGHFRHLPVVEDADDESGEPKLTGVLDVTKVMKDGMERLDRASEQSRKLKEALDALESEWSINAVHIAQYSDVLRDRLSAPTMMSVITDQGHETPIVNIRSNVKDALQVMRATKQTGVSIVDDENNLAGILTTKDVVLRVIAAGLDPERTAVVRVMTPKPDSVPSSMTILDGLKKMYSHRYLHLPVMDGSKFVGMVDVLELTYLIMNQMKAIQTENQQDGPPTMAWSRFWDTTMAQESSDFGGDDRLSHHESFTIRAEDSVSNVGGENESVVSHSQPITSTLQVYKFKDSGGQVHRLWASAVSYAELHKAVARKISRDEADFSLSYEDDDGDPVQLATDEDVVHAVQIAKKLGWPKIMLSVGGPRPGSSKVSALVDPKRALAPAASPVSLSQVSPSIPVVSVPNSTASAAATAERRQPEPQKGAIVIKTAGTLWPPKGLVMTEDGHDLTPLIVGVGAGLLVGLVVVVLMSGGQARRR
ncbi:CBS-domain-containing protein [Gonapodya prolifera JEL478]|uniref:CBS-domain-containing protein n=1 Tax=Gonapodya prolifera (strain JEL478) TaxID=1344416 RepID=A0A139AMG4_GONPJ|nr:CBS-domain-containing protein [Gonapodya prolifera JEL478]|eukprot:KXS17961.1 CBS-domain-containing protein [Gonapodya prolifera JEL478]